METSSAIRYRSVTDDGLTLQPLPWPTAGALELLGTGSLTAVVDGVLTAVVVGVHDRRRLSATGGTRRARSQTEGCRDRRHGDQGESLRGHRGFLLGTTTRVAIRFRREAPRLPPAQTLRAATYLADEEDGRVVGDREVLVHLRAQVVRGGRACVPAQRFSSRAGRSGPQRPPVECRA